MRKPFFFLLKPKKKQYICIWHTGGTGTFFSFYRFVYQ